MRQRLHHLHLAASVIALAAASAWASPALAQQAAAAEPVESVTVTGTSIRGTAPVGSSVTTVTQADIKATGATSVTGILASVPQLMGMGQVDGGTTGQGAQQALIHQLGQSASTSTLTLIDGHRAPTSGTNHSFVDPNMIPINMLERVEVLADGVSAVYGSDAVAGVVNFITRRHFDGVEMTGNAGFADSKQDLNLGFLAGSTWDTGSALFAYSFTRQDLSRPYRRHAACQESRQPELRTRIAAAGRPKPDLPQRLGGERAYQHPKQLPVLGLEVCRPDSKDRPQQCDDEVRTEFRRQVEAERRPALCHP
jgi:iron complex outermembrane receptor protein